MGKFWCRRERVGLSLTATAGSCTHAAQLFRPPLNFAAWAWASPFLLNQQCSVWTSLLGGRHVQAHSIQTFMVRWVHTRVPYPTLADHPSFSSDLLACLQWCVPSVVLQTWDRRLLSFSIKALQSGFFQTFADTFRAYDHLQQVAPACFLRRDTWACGFTMAVILAVQAPTVWVATQSPNACLCFPKYSRDRTRSSLFTLFAKVFTPPQKSQ